MTTHSLVLIDMRVRHVATDTYAHVANFGSAKVDLLDELGDYLRDVSATGGVSVKNRHYTVVDVDQPAQMRELRVRLDYGRFGTLRTVRSVATGLAQGVVNTDETASDTLRAAFHVPPHGVVGVAAFEVAGQASSAGLLSGQLKEWFHARHRGYALEMDYVNDADAWLEFLEHGELKEIIFKKLTERKGDRSAPVTLEEYSVRAPRAEFLPKSWLDRAIKRRIEPGDVLTVPVTDPDEVRVVVQEGGRSRTVRISGDVMPRFTWEIDPESEERPVDGRVYAVAEEIMVQHLQRLKADPTDS